MTPVIPEGPTLVHTPARDTGGAALAPALMPERIDQRYVCIRELGRGGMGQVFLAHDSKIDRQVAIKVLAPGSHGADELRRFELEVRAAGSLNHPNVLTVHDVGSHEGGPYMVTELLEGRTLRRALGSGPLPADTAADYARQLARGLAAAHVKGIVHRDLKPENVFITDDGRVKILDFGIAKLLGAAKTGRGAGTDTGAIIGTVGYMSPEQIRGEPADQRSDIFSFGAILYEMLSGKLAFPAQSVLESGASILTGNPEPLRGEVPAALRRAVQHCLEKDPANRCPSALELAAELESVGGPAAPSRKLRGIAFAAAALAAGAMALFLVRREARIRWAREEAIPRISELVEGRKFAAAVALAEEVEPITRTDPILAKLWPEMTRLYDVETVPSGADVYMREYALKEGDWNHLGRSPIRGARLPRVFYRWKIVKDGLSMLEAAPTVAEGAPTILATRRGLGKLKFVLDDPATLPPGMVRVQGGTASLDFTGLPKVELPGFSLDRTEVTNREYKQFVDAGGYQRKDFWRHEFVKDGRSLSWQEALSAFRDRTGRPGPATWESGDFPDGEADFPVTGVSWYEAAAYAAFAGKSLPTIHHWYHAAGLFSAPWIIPDSNFSGTRLAPAGRAGLGPYGTFDMAGNAKEWCWNSVEDKRYILGGGFDEPPYMFGTADAQLPFDRSAHNGFRLAKYPDEEKIPKVAFAPSPRVTWPDYGKRKPVSDEIFSVYKGLYAYERNDLGAVVDSVDDGNERWRKEKISFNAAYANERMSLYLFTPRRVAPPWQPVVYFPGSYAIALRSSHDLDGMEFLTFIIKSGRAVLYPVYKSTYERGDGFEDDIPTLSSLYRDHVIQWSKDLGRTLDYLETRKDLDHTRTTLYGFSWGAEMLPILAAVEDRRITAGILLSGGFPPGNRLPEVDHINFLPRARQPMLMINGKYDFIFPYDSSQVPMFRLLGTRPEDKRHVVFEGGHRPTGDLVMKEILEWLDRHPGPVR